MALNPMYLYAFWESGKFGNICFLVISWLKLGMHIIYIEQNRRLSFNKSSKYTRFYIKKYRVSVDFSFLFNLTQPHFI